MERKEHFDNESNIKISNLYKKKFNTIISIIW